MSGDRIPNKLHKKRVTFTPSTDGDPDIDLVAPNIEVFTPHTSYYPDYEPIFPSQKPVTPPMPNPYLWIDKAIAPLTPEATPPKLKKSSSWYNKLRMSNPNPEPTIPPSTNTDEWHHHASYFPEYEPIFPSSFSRDPYPYSTAKMTAQQHSAALGHAIAVHYPSLPSWAEYQAGSGVADKAKAGWRSGNTAMEGWTGYGWEGEKLPTAEGLSFAAPMAKGVPLEGEGGKKKKGGGGGGKKKGEEGEEGDDEEGEKDEAEVGGGEGGEEGGGDGGGGEEGGGGGGGKKKNKRKK